MLKDPGLDSEESVQCWRILAMASEELAQCWRILAMASEESVQCWRILAMANEESVQCWRIQTMANNESVQCWRILTMAREESVQRWSYWSIFSCPATSIYISARIRVKGCYRFFKILFVILCCLPQLRRIFEDIWSRLTLWSKILYVILRSLDLYCN